jgi:transformation/transcription domain-associated protein
MAHFTMDRELTECMDWFVLVLLEVNPHVFQEVWTHKIEFFLEMAQTKEQLWLLHICQGLFSRETISPTLLAIMLRFLMDRLPLLGELTDHQAGAVLRMFKVAFGTVSQFSSTNESILSSHLPKLIMDCFPLAAKSSNPTHYFHLLRLLFRVIGAGGGRFETLFTQVVPLLPDMLESLNRQLLSSDGASRDLIVELCLTVPLRLTHLLPHLNYLMQPLVHALRGGPELVSQGLRTLELCIDNLTPVFLDPTLNTVLRELMEALHSHLKPLPADHHHAHTTIRILGKLGGRNRKLLSKEPLLEYRPYSEPAKVSVLFGGISGDIDLGPMSKLAAKSVQKAKGPYRVHAYTYLETCLAYIVQQVPLMLFHLGILTIDDLFFREFKIGPKRTYLFDLWKAPLTASMWKKSKK